MQINECKEEMEVLWRRDGYADKKGKILRVVDGEVLIKWEDGRSNWYVQSLSQMTIINRDKWEREREMKFFAHTGHGNCPCGISYDSGLCNYH